MIQALPTQPLGLFQAFVTELNEMCERYHMDIDTTIYGQVVVDAAPVHRPFIARVPPAQEGQGGLSHVVLARRYPTVYDDLQQEQAEIPRGPK